MVSVDLGGYLVPHLGIRSKAMCWASQRLPIFKWALHKRKLCSSLEGTPAGSSEAAEGKKRAVACRCRKESPVGWEDTGANVLGFEGRPCCLVCLEFLLTILFSFFVLLFYRALFYTNTKGGCCESLSVNTLQHGIRILWRQQQGTTCK